MVSGGTVTGDLNTFKSYLDKLTSEVDSLSSNWKGQSYDNLNSKAGAFVSEYSGTLSGQMSAFASACDLYVEYQQTKNSLAAAQSAAEPDSGQISSYQSKLSSLKSQIESLLATAGSGQLTATSTSTSTVDAGADATVVSTAEQNPNYIYSTKYTGYVFPFEKGVRAPITSHIGKRSAPMKGASTNHQGTDIGVVQGTPIHAIYSGTVVTAKEFGGYGNCVRVQQDDGNLTYYAHCSALDVKEGDRVEAGDVVGRVGSTGNSTGPHLHLEIRAADYKETKNLIDSEDIFEGVWPT